MKNTNFETSRIENYKKIIYYILFSILFILTLVINCAYAESSVMVAVAGDINNNYYEFDTGVYGEYSNSIEEACISVTNKMQPFYTPMTISVYNPNNNTYYNTSVAVTFNRDGKWDQSIGWMNTGEYRCIITGNYNHPVEGVKKIYKVSPIKNILSLPFYVSFTN